MKPGVSRADPADSVLVHQHSRVKVVHLIAAHIGQLRDGLFQYGRVTGVARSNEIPGESRIAPTNP